MFGEPLRDAAELGQNQQVFYRMDTHLLPAGLVEEKPRADRPRGREQARQFRLTESGAEWVDAHAGEIAQPATREETQRMVVEAHDDAASAKASVQNYRKKLSRMKGHVDDLGDELAEIDARHAHDYERVADVERMVEQAQRRTVENQTAIEKARNEVEARATIEDVKEVRADLDTLAESVETRLGETNERLETLATEYADAERSRVWVREAGTRVGYGAVIVYLVVLGGSVVFAPSLMVTVLIGGLCGVLGIGIGTAVSASAVR